MDLKNKKVLVVGLGTSGEAASRLLLNKHASLWITEKADNAQVRKIAHDLTKNGAVVELGGHTEEFVRDKDLIVVSPGVGPKSEVIRWAKGFGIPVVSELEFASWYIKCPLICVTGTNGKSTVTSLIDHILRHAGKVSTACGNLGVPLSEVAIKNNKLDFAVVEVSSFQLEYIKHFRPYISLWLNFSYDHLDHHSSMEEYLNTKLRIFENQTEKDWAVVYYEELARVGDIKANKVIYGGEYSPERLFNNESLSGRYNYDNILAAVAAAEICGIENDVIKAAVKNFKPLPHRMQYITSIEGVRFIDDSKATNVHAVIPAINSCSGSIALILGGRDKGDDFTRLKDVSKGKVEFAVIIGEAKEKIIKQLNGIIPIHESETMDDAVQYAYGHASPGMTVLLSPGCSSFDMFRDYKERGEKFRKAVININNQNTVKPEEFCYEK